MADKPWSKKKLKRGQIEQRLKSLHCSFIKEHLPGHALWKSPTGDSFSISYDDCDTEFLEGMVAQIAKWVEEANNYNK